MIYYIDGYNYLFTQGLEDDPFEQSRQEVLEFFAQNVKDLKCIVIFDAHKAHGGLSRTSFENLEVVYTSYDQTADEYILEQLRYIKNGNEITIVSDDRRLLKQAKEFSAHTSSFDKFFKKLIQRKTKTEDKSSSKTFGSKEFQKYLKDFDV